MRDLDDRLLTRLLGPAEPEILCDECFDRLDEYVDAPDAHIPGMRAHLAGCPVCAEEYESLRALAAAPGIHRA